MTAIPWVFALAAVAYFPGLADRTRKHRPIGMYAAAGDRPRDLHLRVRSATLRSWPIAGLSLAAMGFVAMQPIFWTLPTEYMTGFAAAAGIGLINSLGNLGGFLAPNMRDYFNNTVGGNAGLYSLGVAALIGALLFGLTGLFKKANEIEAGHLDQVDAAPVVNH